MEFFLLAFCLFLLFLGLAGGQSALGGRPRRPRSFTMRGEFGGPSPFAKCHKTGKWYDKQTGEECVTMTLDEFMKSYPCVCGEKH